MNNDNTICLSSAWAEDLYQGQKIVLTTNLFHKGNKSIRFTSEHLTVESVSPRNIKAKDGDDKVVYIPLEDYTQHDGQVRKQVQSPAPYISVSLWVIYDGPGIAIGDRINRLRMAKEQA